MERTGGEPDVIAYDKATDQYVLCDCSAESPAGRRSLCFDGKALAARKENKPKGSALDAAQAMGVELMTEQQYREMMLSGGRSPEGNRVLAAHNYALPMNEELRALLMAR